MNWSYRLLRLSLVLVVGLVFGGWTAPWSTVLKDADGTVAGVSTFVHLPSGGTLYEIDASGNVTMFQVPSGKKVWWGVSGASNDFLLQAAGGEIIKAGPASARTAMGLASVAYIDATQTWTADQTFPTVTASKVVSGASPVTGAPDAGSGASILQKYHNTIITNNHAAARIYGLPVISGVSVVYFKFIEGATGSGIILYSATPDEPFMGNGLSGTSHCSLPPGNQYESATVYSVQISGTCKYWYVEATSNWVAGD